MTEPMMDPSAVPPMEEILTDEEKARLRALAKQAAYIRSRDAEDDETAAQEALEDSADETRWARLKAKEES